MAMLKPVPYKKPRPKKPADKRPYWLPAVLGAFEGQDARVLYFRMTALVLILAAFLVLAYLLPYAAMSSGAGVVLRRFFSTFGS